MINKTWTVTLVLNPEAVYIQYWAATHIRASELSCKEQSLNQLVDRQKTQLMLLGFWLLIDFWTEKMSSRLINNINNYSLKALSSLSKKSLTFNLHNKRELDWIWIISEFFL